MVFKFKDQKNFLIFSICCIFILIATNYFPSLSEVINLGVNDAKSYSVFFVSDYDFSSKDFWGLPSHHIDRWPIFFAAQKITSLMPFGWELTSRLITIIVLLIILYQISTLKFSFYIKVIISLFIVFSPYSFRFYLFAPNALSDLLFFFSNFLLLIGIKKENITLSSIGVILGLLSKQTAMLFIPIFFIFFIFNLINIKRLIYLLVLFFLTFALKKFLEFQIFGQIIDPPDAVHLIGFLKYFVDYEATYQSARSTILSLLLLTPMLIFYNYINKRSFYIFLIIFLVFSSQPILGAAGGNIARLITLSFSAIIFLFSDSKEPSSKEVAIFSVIVIISSLHHNYSIIHDSKYLFGAIIFISSLFSLTYAKFNKASKIQ
jgi:hypothetical protein